MHKGILETIKETSPSSGGDSFAVWKKSFFDIIDKTSSTPRAALLAGASTRVPAFVFASGYQSALRKILPVDRGVFASFCITEKAGASPRVLQTRIQKKNGSYILSGEKSFVTMAEESGNYFVCAHESDPAAEKKSFRIVKVDKTADGPDLTDLDISFVSEVSHASAVFKDIEVAPDAVLPGDGYTEYVKPFRTIEDIHLFAAFAGFLLARGFEMHWPVIIMEKLAALVSALLNPEIDSPETPDSVIAVSGIKALFDHIIAESSSLKISDDEKEAEKWHRDKKLFDVAGSVRRKRTDSFWKSFAPELTE